jgi:2,4-dichlorophenol 6-monooxygenase
VVDYAPCGRPGHRAPHLWLEHDGRRTSTLDLFGRGFTLLAGSRGDDWVDAAREASRRLGVRIDAHSIGGSQGWTDPTDSLTRIYGIDATGAVLVRPDGHVAYRSRQASRDAVLELTSTLERILARRPT